MQSVGMIQMLASLCLDLGRNSYLSTHAGDVLVGDDCCTNTELLVQHGALHHACTCQADADITLILLDFGHKLFVINLEQVIIEFILSPICRQMIQQMQIQTVKVLLIDHFFDIHATNVDALAVETHLFL